MSIEIIIFSNVRSQLELLHLIIFVFAYIFWNNSILQCLKLAEIIIFNLIPNNTCLHLKYNNLCFQLKYRAEYLYNCVGSIAIKQVVNENQLISLIHNDFFICWWESSYITPIGSLPKWSISPLKSSRYIIFCPRVQINCIISITAEFTWLFFYNETGVMVLTG